MIRSLDDATMRAIWDLVDADARRALLWSRFPDMAIADAERIIFACQARDRSAGWAAFRYAVEALERARAA